MPQCIHPVNHPTLLPPWYSTSGSHGSLNGRSMISALTIQVVVLNKIDMPHVRSKQEELETKIKAELDHTRFMSIRYAVFYVVLLCAVSQSCV